MAARNADAENSSRMFDVCVNDRYPRIMAESQKTAADEPCLQIGEVADRTGVTQRTLRFYEERGLLKAPSRMDGGCRLYSENDVARVEDRKSTRLNSSHLVSSYAVFCV